MTTTAIIFLVVTIVVVWGGLLVSILALRAKPEATDLPDGGHDDEGPGTPVQRAEQ